MSNLPMDRVLAALEEYFELKRDIESVEEPNLFAAKDRAGKALNEYIEDSFDHLMIEEKRRSTHITQKVKIPDTSSIKFTWDDMVHLLDALNSPPLPPSHQKQSDEKFMDNWMKLYRDWYQNKRPQAMNSISPPLGLDLENDEALK